MKFTPLVLGISAFFVGRAGANEFTRASAFESVDAFVAAATAFQPAKSRSDLARRFMVRELGQAEDPKTGHPRTATSIQSSVVLWSNPARALVFVTAMPPTDATRSAVSVLFLLQRATGVWRISDIRRFVATGSDAGLTAELTAGTGVGYRLGDGGVAPVVTVKESQGGRGYAYQLSASFTVNGSRIDRVGLK